MTTTGTPGSWADDARRYRLESRIATGGMGEVWRATDTTLGRTVAVKLLKNEYADDPSFRSRFSTEARHAAALHHANIASVYDFGEARASDGSDVPRPYLVMELVDGQPLSNLLEPGQPLDPDATRHLLAQAADALAAAHAAGIVHRDVKPANLLVTPDRRVKITDFGIARATEGMGLTQTGQVMGTPQYLSPEQARGNTATPASDVYSLGVVAFECLAGRRPFQADSPVATALAHLNDPVPALPESVPVDLARVVRRALAKDPRERYTDASSFATALRNPAGEGAETQVVAAAPPPADRTQVLSGVAAPVVPPTASTPAAADPDEQDRRRTPWPLIIGLLLLAALVVVLALLLSDGDDDPEEDPPATPTSEPATPTEEPTTEPTTEAPTETSDPGGEETSEGPQTVDVDAGQYEGRNVREVEADLRDLGLRVTLEEIDNPGDREEGVVESVNPTGQVEEGSTITVRYWGPQPEPPAEEPIPDELPGEGSGNGEGSGSGSGSSNGLGEESTNGAEGGTTG